MKEEIEYCRKEMSESESILERLFTSDMSRGDLPSVTKCENFTYTFRKPNRIWYVPQ